MSLRWIVYAIFLTALGVYAVYGQFLGASDEVVSEKGMQVSNAPVEKPLEKYAFVSLAQRPRSEVDLVVEEILVEEGGFTSYLFSYLSEGKRISGQMNVPTGNAPSDGWPVVVLVRGYVDPEMYETGVGTSSAAKYFAERGYLTVSPDFLGYGSSDKASLDVFEDRLRRPVTVLDLLSGVMEYHSADPERVFMWGHSNGGQIALSVLEVIGESRHWSGVVIPTTLWAPVSKPFPYSILYYTDEYDDKGKAIRRELAGFEREYDVDLFSIDEYYGWIDAPIQIHQGTSDDAVPVEWSRELALVLEQEGKVAKYYEYAGADHNLRPAWDDVVVRDIEFFGKFEYATGSADLD